MPVPQTQTLNNLKAPPRKEDLLATFKGRDVSTIRTPAAVIDRQAFSRNCKAMKERCERVGAIFRAHVKSHKTPEGARLQLQTDPPSHAVVCSTLAEMWGLVDAGFTQDGTVTDILYGFPLPADKLEDLFAIQKEVERLTVMIDCAAQVRVLGSYSQTRGTAQPFRAFIKIDQGGARAGLRPESSDLSTLIEAVLQCPALILHGFYSHSGNAYASRTPAEAQSFLETELGAVSAAAQLAHAAAAKLGQPAPELVLAVGSTPTAHASAHLAGGHALPPGTRLEIHAGVYPLLDLQQRATALVGDPARDLALGVLARVCSTYPTRAPPQVLIDAGAIAFSKDTGPSGTFGEVYGTGLLEGWRVVKISQEHGLLSPPEGTSNDSARETLERLELGTVLKIRPQHACLTCAAYPWYYIVDGPDDSVVRDVWVPWKGW